MGGAVRPGLISAVISLIATFVMTLIIPTDDRTWALIAVAAAGFFSGLFSYNAARNNNP